mgnify:CR=1 FL=1
MKKKMKKGKSFPDLTGDGKVTKADVLKGRGVFKDGGMSKRFQEAKKKDRDEAYKLEYGVSKEQANNMKARTKKAMGGPVEVKADDSVDTYGNPKGKKKSIQLKGWGKARH